jgi:hypothetical protein
MAYSLANIIFKWGTPGRSQKMTVNLFKKTGTYFSEKDHKDKQFTNFYIQCNDQLIPVEIKYFPNPQFQDRDPGYQGRFAVLSAFAEVLPEKEDKDEAKASDAAAQSDSSKKEHKA